MRRVAATIAPLLLLMTSASVQAGEGLDIKRAGAQPSAKGPAEYFTGAVRVDRLFQAELPWQSRGGAVIFERGVQQFIDAFDKLFSAIARRRQTLLEDDRIPCSGATVRPTR